MFLHFSSKSYHFFLIWEKPISFCHFRPACVQNSLFCTEAGLILLSKIGLFRITDFWLGVQKNGTNIICLSIKDTYFFKILRMCLENWASYVFLKFKIELGIAGSNFELHLWYLKKMFIFWRQTNDITIIFWNFVLHQF